MSRKAADAVCAQLRAKPDSLLVLATGTTPTRCYELLAEAGDRSPGLFANVRILKLDEWGGLELDDPATCESQLRQLLLKPLRLREDQYFGWESRPTNLPMECQRIDRWLKQNGPADLSILGLGLNGHLGFNEPAEFLQLGPHEAQLSPTSLSHSMLGPAHTRPQYGLTLGMGDLLASRRVFLLATGASKREPLRTLLRQEVRCSFPASFLWLHPSTTLFCDRAAMPGGDQSEAPV